MRLHDVAYFAATAALFATVSSAQDRAQRFEQRDVNGDGVLSQGEYTSTGGHPGNFRALDVNGDGLLSREEFVGRTGAIEDPAVVDPYYDGRDLRGTGAGVGTYQSAAGPEFARLDTNRDRLLSRAEWPGDTRSFRRMDANNDGLVTTSEYVNYDAANVGLAKDDGYNRGTYGGYPDDGALHKDQGGYYGNDGALRKDGGSYGNDGVYRSGGVYAKDVGRFEDYDRNRDGVLSRYEWTGDRATFDRMDRNQDGVIAYREFDAMPAGDTGSLRARRFDQLDRNRNGVVDRGEWTGSSSSFRALDRNRDGRLSRAEYAL